MARVKRSVAGRKSRKATLVKAKGYYGNKSRSFRAANEQVMHRNYYTTMYYIDIMLHSLCSIII